uniref:Uncharacterized protein n=1 Tax=Spironucleus salmonicida TaxID=348837 RepID=V6LPA3_9EUKA|eukprot:EST46507.1 Hypothetical protein SS50377_13590 [Spironucleus salmonicida]
MIQSGISRQQMVSSASWMQSVTQKQMPMQPQNCSVVSELSLLTRRMLYIGLPRQRENTKQVKLIEEKRRRKRMLRAYVGHRLGTEFEEVEAEVQEHYLRNQRGAGKLRHQAPVGGLLARKEHGDVEDVAAEPGLEFLARLYANEHADEEPERGVGPAHNNVPAALGLVRGGCLLTVIAVEQLLLDELEAHEHGGVGEANEEVAEERVHLHNLPGEEVHEDGLDVRPEQGLLIELIRGTLDWPVRSGDVLVLPGTGKQVAQPERDVGKEEVLQASNHGAHHCDNDQNALLRQALAQWEADAQVQREQHEQRERQRETEEDGRLGQRVELGVEGCGQFEVSERVLVGQNLQRVVHVVQRSSSTHRSST